MPLIQPPGLLLGSSSPRRQELLRAMGLQFETIRPKVEERYPKHLKGHEITNYLCQLKADSLKSELKPGYVLLTADTIVWHKGAVLEKPGSPAEAEEALRQLSGQRHEVITSIALFSLKQEQVASEKTVVEFAELSQEEIALYMKLGNPMDKAGAYGIQEWIGLIGVSRIQGSYTNVVGLPTRLVYKTLRAMGEQGF